MLLTATPGLTVPDAESVSFVFYATIDSVSTFDKERQRSDFVVGIFPVALLKMHVVRSERNPIGLTGGETVTFAVDSMTISTARLDAGEHDRRIAAFELTVYQDSDGKWRAVYLTRKKLNTPKSA